jgi:hypothetical protein
MRLEGSMATEYHINVDRFNAVFPLMQRWGISNAVVKAVAGVAERFEPYWAHLGHAFNRHDALPKSLMVLDDLFPPNLAVLDWFLDQEFDADTCIADIPCGLGNLMVYLRQSGFYNVWGYDNWVQIDRRKAVDFLTQYQAQDCLVNLPTIVAKPVDILCAISLPFEWLLPDIQPIIDEVQYVLLDSGYVPKSGSIEGFEEVGRYPGLLVVYKRRDDNGKA